MGLLSMLRKSEEQLIRLLNYVFLFAIGVVAVVSSGCEDGTKEPPGEINMSEITILQTDQNKTFETHPGDLILIRLPENPATGYQWEIKAVDDQVVEFQDSDFAMAPGTGIGGDGMRTFAVRAQEPGTARIRLQLKREWEPEDASIDNFGVTIRVRAE